MLMISINTSYKNEAKTRKKKKVCTNITDVYIYKGSLKNYQAKSINI